MDVDPDSQDGGHPPSVAKKSGKASRRQEPTQTPMEVFERGVTPQNMLEMAGVMIVILNVEGRVVFVNEKTCRVMGFQKDEIVGKNWFDSFVPSIMRETARRLFDRLTNGKVQDLETYENPVLTKGGQEREIFWSSEVLRDEHDKVVGAISSGKDVTDRKSTEHLIAYRAGLIDIVNDAIIALDVNMIIRIWNKAAESMYGWTAEEVVGKALGDVILGYHGIDQKDIRDRLIKADRMRWEAVQERKDGTKIHVEGMAVTSRDSYGRINGFVSVNRDISSRVKAEDDLRSTRNYLENLIDYADAPIIVWDPSFRITRFNHAFEHMTGYFANEMLGGDLHVLFPSDTREDSLTKIKKTLDGEHWDSVEIPILRKDGGLRWALWNSANIYSEDGKTQVATIAQGQDITERKQAEENTIALNESLVRQKIELEAVNRVLEAFNYSVSHDLRAPLRAIDGFSSALLEDYGDKLDDTGKDYLNRVRNASQRMAQLIDDLLKLSRVTQEKMNWEMVDLSSIAQEVARELQRNQPDRKVDFIICEGAQARGDPRLLRILMENVIGNAWKFTSGKDSPRIEFGVTMVKDERVFYVRDNGAGFDMKYADKLFTPFQRLHSLETFPGSGVGLATAMRIIRKHGGRMWAEGEINKGATFYFSLARTEDLTIGPEQYSVEARKHD